MLVKVCGLVYKNNIQQVLQLKPDFMGFNFYSQSPRYVNEETLLALKEIDFGTVKKAGVFVNEVTKRVLSLADKYHLQYIQLHGNESVKEIEDIKKYFPVIKVVGIETKEDMQMVSNYDGTCDYILLDKKSFVHGGSGVPFNWNLLEYYTFNTPFILAGGISPENISKAKSINHPKFAGFDLNSCFEDSPGMKNIQKLKSAFTA